MIAVLKRKKSKSAQFRFVTDEPNRRLIVGEAGWDGFPSRSTFFRRYRRAYQLFRTAIKLQGEKAVAEGVADPQVVAADKSLVAARGPLWHKRDRQANRIPKGLHGVDQESGAIRNMTAGCKAIVLRWSFAPRPAAPSSPCRLRSIPPVRRKRKPSTRKSAISPRRRTAY